MPLRLICANLARSRKGKEDRAEPARLCSVPALPQDVGPEGTRYQRSIGTAFLEAARSGIRAVAGGWGNSPTLPLMAFTHHQISLYLLPIHIAGVVPMRSAFLSVNNQRR